MIKSSITLREYQHEIVDKVVMAKEGIVEMSTGSGKTIVGLEVISRLGLTATILVPNTVLLDNWVSECEKWLGFRPGIINSNEKTIKPITVSTFQSLQANPEILKNLAKNTSILMVDECHGAVTDQKIELLKSFSPKHLYGFTGTLGREDGKGPAIKFVFGREIVKFHLEQLRPSVHVYMTGVDINVDEYNIMIDEMVSLVERNKLVMGTAAGECISGRKVLVLTKRREHAKNLHELFPGAHLIDSEDKGRNALLQRMKFGEEEFQCIIGTTALLGTGTDIPSLDTLILACDMKSQILATQSVGRILRLFEGKPDPKIYDLWDGYRRMGDGKFKVTNPMLHAQFKTRLEMYASKGWKISGVPEWMIEDAKGRWERKQEEEKKSR